MATSSQSESAEDRISVQQKTDQNNHDTTFMPLMPHILKAKNNKWKSFWIIVLFIVLLMLVCHIYQLSKLYGSFQKHSKVVMVSDKFEFPSVTFCNINPMRMSQKEKVDQKLQELIEAIDPRVIIKSLNNYTSNSYLNKTFGETPPTLDDVYAFMNWSRDSQTDRSPIKCQNCEDLFTKRSPPNKIQSTFAEYFSDLNETTRMQVGHQLEDMMLRCFFDGDYCNKSHFKPMLSDMYGNCYTWNNNNAVSLYNGRNRGLEVTLYLETMEYIPGAKNSEGLTLIIHEQGTYPLPWDEGITLSGGTLAFITLKMSKIERLGKQYGPCESSDSFKEQYGWKYTLNLCYKICEQKDLRKRCGCVDTMETEINAILKNPDNLRNCSHADKKDYDCIHKDYDASSCNCISSCSEKVYSKQLSYNRWPTTHFLDVLIAKICQDKSNETCDRVKNQSHEKLISSKIKHIAMHEFWVRDITVHGFQWDTSLVARATQQWCYELGVGIQEAIDTNVSSVAASTVAFERVIRGETAIRNDFLHVIIYFETPGFDKITEEAEMTFWTFASDIGGALGLWLGLSAVGVVELFYYCFCRCCCCCCSKNNKSKEGKPLIT